MTLSSHDISSNSMLERQLQCSLADRDAMLRKDLSLPKYNVSGDDGLSYLAFSFSINFSFFLIFLQSLVLMIEEIFAWNLSLKVHQSICTVLLLQLV